MISVYLLSAVLAYLGIVSSASSVLELTDKDFSTRVKDYDSMLIMFYAPWCGHCKKLKPEFEKAATALLANDYPIQLAKVDCTDAGKETCNKFSVSGYPTLKIFKDGEISKEYQGPREYAGIIKYMKAQVGPSTKDISSAKVLDAFISESDPGVVGYFKDDNDLKAAFMKVADKLREKVRFGLSATLSAEEGSDKEGIVLYRPKHLHNKFEPSSVKYEGAANKADIESWVQNNLHGLADHRVRENMDGFKNPLVVAYYKVDYIKNPKGTNYWRNRILKVAKDFKDDFTFAVSSKDDFQHELNEFGYDYVPSEKPVVFARSKDNKKYAMTEEFSIENFESFLKSLKDGTLEPYLKSEAIPEDNDKPVTVAVGKNFDDVVTNNGKDTFIKFYAPWCGHCKKIAPVWDELGEKMANEDVAIVKMDATSNDVPSTYDVRGFPTLFWVPKDSKSNPVVYNGGRELEDFIKYIAAQSTTELKGYDRSGNAKSKDEL